MEGGGGGLGPGVWEGGVPRGDAYSNLIFPSQFLGQEWGAEGGGFSLWTPPLYTHNWGGGGGNRAGQTALAENGAQKEAEDKGERIVVVVRSPCRPNNPHKNAQKLADVKCTKMHKNAKKKKQQNAPQNAKKAEEGTESHNNGHKPIDVKCTKSHVHPPPPCPKPLVTATRQTPAFSGRRRARWPRGLLHVARPVSPARRRSRKAHSHRPPHACPALLATQMWGTLCAPPPPPPQGCIGRGKGYPPAPGRPAYGPATVPPDAKCQPQRHFQPTVTAPNRFGNPLQPPA